MFYLHDSTSSYSLQLFARFYLHPENMVATFRFKQVITEEELLVTV